MPRIPIREQTLFGTDVEPDGSVYVRWANLRLTVDFKIYDLFDKKLCNFLTQCASDAIVLARTPKSNRIDKVTYRIFAKKKSDLVLLKLKFDGLDQYIDTK